jgi:hypothetical protein
MIVIINNWLSYRNKKVYDDKEYYWCDKLIRAYWVHYCYYKSKDMKQNV